MEFLYLFIGSFGKRLYETLVYQQIGDYINLIFNEDDIRYLDLERLFLCLSFLINTENYLNMEDKIKLQSFNNIFIYK